DAEGAGDRAGEAGIVVDAVYETYFQTLHEASNTSNHTLAMLPVLEHKEFVESLARARPKHELQIGLLASLHAEQFRQWYFELHNGFNLVFFGYGSKRDLLSDFAARCAEGSPLLVINGYFPAVGPRDFLAKILDGVLGCPALAKGTVEEQASLVAEAFAGPASDRPHERMYVLVHNIDGPALRAERTQAILSVLASCAKIHMIASVDHVNAPLLWDTVKAARFNWLWHDATTFRPYAAETTYENSIMVRRGELGPRGVGFVLASLTANMKKIFRILAERQIAAAREREPAASDAAENRAGTDSSEENEEDDYEGAAASCRQKRKPAPLKGRTATTHADLGLPYRTFYSLAREAFLTNSDQAFQSQLTEFRDHRIIHSRRAGDGTETVYIPLGAEILAGVLEKMET
ncbi:MAG: origin recognition complex, subunit 2, partial [Olpidium bornovanus]